MFHVYREVTLDLTWRFLAAAAALSAWVSSGAAALSASAASFSAFARMAVCATKDTLELNAIAPQTIHR